MSDRFYEVLIVGAGPAGALAAERLACKGVRVALFDGRPDSEPKACGGGVTSKALRAYPQLLKTAGRTINEVEMYSPLGRHLQLRLSEPFAIYSRRALDAGLRREAQRSGAHLFKERVNVEANAPGNEGWTLVAKSGEQRRWRGRILVAADGANSSIARRCAGVLPPAEMEVAFGYRAPLTPQYKTECSREPSTVIAFLPDWAGYAWAFPRLDHISFGIATMQDGFAHKPLDELLWSFMIGYYRRGAGNMDNSFWSALQQRSESDRLIEAKLRTTVERYAARIPGVSTETWSERRVVGGNWALLGDAAGFADAVTGEGIYYALRSAELFAEAYLSGSLISYEEMWREDFGRELLRAASMRKRFYGTFLGAPFTQRMIQFAGKHQRIKKTLGELIAGDQGYTNLKKNLLRRAIWVG